MAVYAIGDIQGYFDPLRRLLDALRFDPAVDRVWLVGDLVNRGPSSLEVLRFVKGLGEAATAVLGNHDLHLLAVQHAARPRKRRDTLRQVLDASDRDELLGWLRHRPLLHHDPGLGYTLVHAGLAPQWDLATAQACAREVETALRGPEYARFLEQMYGDQPDRWSDTLAGWDRLRFITNCLTRMRYCDVEGRLDLDAKGSPGAQPAGLVPWFRVPGRRHAGLRVVFGHWSQLGLMLEEEVIALDTGCVWGGALTAARLDGPERRPVSVDCRS